VRQSVRHAGVPVSLATLGLVGYRASSRLGGWRRSTGRQSSTSEATELVRFGPAVTAGSYVVEVGSFPPGEPGPPFHLHPNTDETSYVADGQATFQLGDRELQVGAGGLVFVPRGTAHTVWNSGDVAVRGLILISPGERRPRVRPGSRPLAGRVGPR
jgi:quercetin dioxygenase-like cupin family protein